MKFKRTTLKERRKKELKEKKSFFPLLAITSVAWTVLVLMLFFTSPTNAGAVPAFIVMLFVALTLIGAIIFANTRRAFVVSVAIIFFLTLRLIGVGNFLNLFLIAGVVLAFEYYYKSS